jgi:hypothetical protein
MCFFVRNEPVLLLPSEHVGCGRCIGNTVAQVMVAFQLLISGSTWHVQCMHSRVEKERPFFISFLGAPKSFLRGARKGKGFIGGGALNGDGMFL